MGVDGHSGFSPLEGRESSGCCSGLRWTTRLIWSALSGQGCVVMAFRTALQVASGSTSWAFVLPGGKWEARTASSSVTAGSGGRPGVVGIPMVSWRGWWPAAWIGSTLNAPVGHHHTRGHGPSAGSGAVYSSEVRTGSAMAFQSHSSTSRTS